MKKHFSIVKVLVVGLDLVCAFVMNTTTVFAASYIDPATTGYIVQIIAGVIIACSTFLAIFWNKIKRKFRKEKPAEDTAKNLKTSDMDEGAVIKAEDLLEDDKDRT